VAYNLALSKRRVAAVRDGLVAAGVDSARVTTSFVGKSGLLNAEKDTRELALNRRVEFKYYDRNGAAIATTKQTQDIQLEQPRARKPAPAHRPAAKPAAGAKPAAKPVPKPASSSAP